MNTLQILWHGKTETVTSNKTGSSFTLSELWFKSPNSPYPENFKYFGEIPLPQGAYNIPYVIELDYKRNLSISLDFSKAVKIEGK